MALPSIGNFLEAQQSINPFAAQALQEATAGSGQLAQQQQEAALAQLAMQPNVAQQAASPEAATTGMAATVANVRQPRLGNLGFSSLNALASQTPQISYSPTNIEGGALGQGIANIYNIQQQRQAQENIMGLMQQQQAAAEQQIAAQQAAAQQKAALEAQQAQQQVAALSNFMTPEQALGVVASGQGGTALAKLGGLVEAGADVGGARIRRQGALEIAPTAGQPIQSIPLSPIDTATVQGILPEFSQQQPTIDLAKAEQEKAKALYAAGQQQLDTESKQADVEGKKIENYLKPVTTAAELELKRADTLEKEGKVMEAQFVREQQEARKQFARQYLEQASNLSPEQRNKMIATYVSFYGGKADDLGGFDEFKKVGEDQQGFVSPIGGVSTPEGFTEVPLQVTPFDPLPLTVPNRPPQAPTVVNVPTSGYDIRLPQNTNIGAGRGLKGGLQGSLRPIELGG